MSANMRWIGDEPSRARRGGNGFMFIELLISLIVIGGTMILFADTIIRDLTHTRYSAWNEIARNAAQSDLQHLSRYLGHDVVANLPNCPETESFAGTEYALDFLPWAQGYRCQHPHNTYPEVRELTVTVQAYYGKLDGNDPPAGANLWSWTYTTLVAKGGVDGT